MAASCYSNFLFLPPVSPPAIGRGDPHAKLLILQESRPNQLLTRTGPRRCRNLAASQANPVSQHAAFGSWQVDATGTSLGRHQSRVGVILLLPLQHGQRHAQLHGDDAVASVRQKDSSQGSSSRLFEAARIYGSNPHRRSRKAA